MGSLRFRKQFKLAPGVKLNVNKQSVSVSLGGRGGHLTFNTKGQRTASVGLPGTGLWYRDTRKVGSKAGRAARRTGSEPVRDPFIDPLWGADVNGTQLAIMFDNTVARNPDGTHGSYDLWVADKVTEIDWRPEDVQLYYPWGSPYRPCGKHIRQWQWQLAGRYGPDYFEARAAADVWAAYLRHGGTVAAWLEHGSSRQRKGTASQISKVIQRFGRS